jgi:L-arabinose isomerase
MPKLPVGRALWKPRPNLQDSAQCWLMTGSSHHTALTTNTDIETWQDFARILGVEFFVINEHTCPITFEEILNISNR